MTLRVNRDGSRMTWRTTVLTLFPEMFPGPLGVTPAGGGPGMGLRADVLAAAIDAADIAADRPRLLMSARGRPLTQSMVTELARGHGPLIVCGRFEGVDQRVIEARRLEEVSVGDYVLSGGEIAAMALI